MGVNTFDNWSHIEMPGDTAQDARCPGRLDGMPVFKNIAKSILLLCRLASTSSSTCCRRLCSAPSPFWTGLEWKIVLAKNEKYLQVSAKRDCQCQSQEIAVGWGCLYAHCRQVCKINLIGCKCKINNFGCKCKIKRLLPIIPNHQKICIIIW